MIGNNTITLNEATMKAAIQHYFNNVLFVEGKAPTVQHISWDSNTRCFDVATKDKEEVS